MTRATTKVEQPQAVLQAVADADNSLWGVVAALQEDVRFRGKQVVAGEFDRISRYLKTNGFDWSPRRLREFYALGKWIEESRRPAADFTQYPVQWVMEAKYAAKSDPLRAYGLLAEATSKRDLRFNIADESDDGDDYDEDETDDNEDEEDDDEDDSSSGSSSGSSSSSKNIDDVALRPLSIAYDKCFLVMHNLPKYKGRMTEKHRQSVLNKLDDIEGNIKRIRSDLKVAKGSRK